MIELHETVDVARPVDEVFDYIADFSTTAEWDSTVIRARRLTPGKIDLGSEFEVVCALPIGSVRLRYRIKQLQPGKLVVLRGTCPFFDIKDTIALSPSARGTTIDYRAKFVFKPTTAALSGLFRRGLERMGQQSVAGLASALEDRYSLDRVEPRPAKGLVSELSLFTNLGYRLGYKRFNPVSANVKGKHMVVTGASAGLGYETALELARRGAHLTLILRDPVKAETSVAELQRTTGNDHIRYELADLSLMKDVDALTERFRERGQAIDVLVNNAGALFNPREETSEGLEKSYALLLLSPYRLTEGLKPLLLKAQNPRVINVVSGGMYTQKLDLAALPNPAEAPYAGSVAYAREKRALMVLTEEWAKLWAQEGIVVNAMHPGWADTPGVQSALPEFRCIMRRVLRSAAQGADTIVWLAVATEAGRVSGKLFLDREIRSTHLLEKTRESSGEGRKLLDFLSRQAEAEPQGDRRRAKSSRQQNRRRYAQQTPAGNRLLSGG